MELLEDRLAPAIEPTFRGGLTVAAADIDGDRIPDFVGAPSADAPVRVAIYAGTDGGLIKTLTPFEAEFTGGAFVAVGDVTGDGKPEVIVSAASGEPRVVVFEAITGELQARFLAYDASFGGGVRVAVGDIDGDGRAEIVTAPGTGGGPHIRVFDGVGRNLGRDYMAYDPTFRGGASVAAGDTDGDGVDDIITGAGVGGGPHVVVVSGRTDATLESYFAYNFGFQGGVWVSAGDVDGNGLADVITGAGTGGGAHVRAFAGRGTPFAEWFAYEPEFHGGVRVAVADLNGDGFADVITGPGVGGGPRVTMWDGYQFTRTQNFFGVTDGQPLGFGLLAPPPRTPLYDGVTFVAPGAPGTLTRLTSDVLRRFTDLPGELGVFRVDDREGRVGGLLPGAEGYGKAALAQDRRTQLFTPDAAPGTGGEFELEGSTRYGFYLIRGGLYEDWAASGFTDRFGLGAVFPFAAANPGGTQQFRAGPRNRAAFEDVSGLDGDFNDVIVDVRLTGEASDLPGGTARPPNTLPANRPPDAVNDVATTGFETPVLVSVLANDTDSDGDLLTITSATKPAHGTLRVLGSHVEYTPDTGFKGVDAFSYTIADGRGGTDTAGVIVTVGSPNLPPLPPTNHPPVAADDVVATAFETAVTIDVLANDTDPDTDPLSVTGTTQPLNGSVRIVGGRIEYAPAIGFRGIDTFEYTIEDGRGGKNTAVVTVSVGTPINNNPPVARDDTANTRYETTVSIDVLANDTDPDGDPLTISLAKAPTHGTARLSGNRIEYSPASGFAGADTLTYTVRDGRGGTSTATVRVSVELPTLAINRPPDAVNDTVFTTFQTAVSIDVLANDTDPDGDPLTVAIAVAPIHGTIRLVGTRIEYTPDAGYHGVDVFHYAIADGQGGGDMASVSVTVEPPVTVKDFTDWTPAERGGSATRRGTVAIAGTTATLREGDSFVTTLSRSFTVVAGATPLQFTYSGLQFDSGASSFVKDSFEAALVDAAGNALVAAYSPGRDAFFNVTDGQPAVTGAGTSLDARAVSLDLSAVPVGTAATLIFRLVNNDSDRGSTVTLTSYTLPTTAKADAAVKFFVVDPAADGTFRYGDEGLSAGRFALPAGEVRGVASNPAGDTVWTVDRSTKQIHVFDATGNPLGNWIASDALSPEGVTVNNGDLWLVDRGSHTVRHYIGGAVRRSGTVAASDSFALSLDNSSPSDLVTDGGTVWVTDDVRAEVFVYDVSGALLGRWKLDGDNAAPSGITRNPAGGTDLWVLDRGTKRVFQYSNGSNLRTGSATADGTFDLGPDVTSPEGIADPPQSAAGHSLPDESGRAVFDSGADFREGTLFNLTAVDGTGDLRLNDQGVTEIPPFIWVSNASEGSVSRFDTRTGVEVARYRTGPESLGARLSPSRTAVAGDGSAWVANRSNRDGGTLSSIVHVYLEDFVDRNRNGKIDTSVDADNNGQIDAAEMLPWDANNDGQPDDERIAISIDVGRDRNNTALALPNSVARAIAIDANDNVWVGLFNRQQYEAYDGASGSLLGIVPVSGTPYGAVVDNKGVLWGATRAGFVERIDTATMQALPSVDHPGDNYGITVGPDGAVWTSNYFSSNLVRIDPDTLVSTQYAAPGYGNFRGVSIDDDNNVWVATNSPDALVRFHFDADGKTLIDTRGVRVGSVASAAVIDADGYVWTTTYGDNKAWKIDPVTLAVVPGWPIATGPEPYNYSDMTGRVRLGVTQRTGTWTETVDAGRDDAVWGGVELDAFLPDVETSVVVRARSADSVAALSQLGWRTIDPGTAYRDVRGRYLQVELSLRSREPDFNPVVNSFAVVGVPPPQLSVTAPADGSSLPPGSSVVLSGLATASRPPLGAGHFGPNRVIAVTVNGQPVEALDASGRFFTRVGVLPGENRYAVVAYDEYGQSASVVHTTQSLARPTGPLDSRQFVDLSATFRAEYARTSFNEDTRSLFAQVAVRNAGNYSASVPLYVAVANVSDPTVKALNPAGTLDDGTPYYDFTGLVSGGGRQLEPNAATGWLELSFSAPDRKRFTYDLVFLGVLNRPPVFASIPALEANPARPYAYASSADDPDGDALRYSLVAGPDGMTLNSTSGLLNWTPTETQLGSFDVTIQVDDGRGGSAEQRYAIVSQVAPPNRPPVFTSIPVDQASVGGVYRYDADAIDPDGDTLTYSLATGAPAGMAIDATTGVITWTPTAAQIGDRPVTVAVADGRGGTATQTFTICVDAGRNRPPVIVSTPVTVAKTVPLLNRDVLQYENVWRYRVVNFGELPGFEQRGYDDSEFVVGQGGFGSGGGCFLNQTARHTDWPTNSDILLRKLVVLPAGVTRLVVRGAIDNDVQIWVNGQDISQGLVATEGCAELNEFTITAPDSVLRLGENLVAVRARDRGSESYVDVTVALMVPETWVPGTTQVVGGYSYQVAALDPDGGSPTYSLSEKPAGMVIDSATGLITWLPGVELAERSVPVTVRVDDGLGGSDEQRFSVTITDCGPNTARGFDPVVEWHKDTFAVRPDSNQVMMTPAVIDLNRNGTPDIVFSTYTGGNFYTDGLLRAVSGADGRDLWTVTDPAYEVVGGAGVAVGDLDGDGSPEIVAVHESYGLIAFGADGRFKWLSQPLWSGQFMWGGPAIADLNGDGSPEVVFGGIVLNADGTLRWDGAAAGGLGRGTNGYAPGPLSLVADIDRDGSPEVVAGRTAYRADGTLYWNSPVPDGFPAVGNFDADANAEIALVSSGNLYLLEHDGTVKWGPVPIPGGGEGGPPTIADFDNDGLPEIGVAGASRYTVFDTDGSVLWSAPTQDASSRMTGSSVFDFDGDGSAEVVYGDELFLRIYRGIDGKVLYELPKSSGTTYEYPVIVDVDGDGNAEIVAVANGLIGGEQNGIYVIGDRNNTWVNTRKVWNQHSYHVTNVNDDGTVPAHEANSWELYNSYRTNVLTVGFDPRGAADLVVTATALAAGVATARVGNTGTAPVAPGVAVAFFDGDPAKGGRLLGKSPTATRLRTGDSEAVTFALAGLVNDLWVRVDDDGTGVGAVPECDETNNAFRAKIDTDPVNYAPVFKSTPPASVAANGRYLYRSVVLEPDGDPVTYDIVSGPVGLQVHPTLGVVAWTPFRDQVGPHAVVLRATDGHGNATLQAFTVGVTIPNTAPIVTSVAPNGQAVVGKPFGYAVSAQDAEQSTLFYSLVNPLAGMAVDSQGVFTWSPSAGDVGSKAATVRVSDGVGGITDQTFPVTVAVSAPNHAPVATLDARTSAWLGRDYIGRIIASDADGDLMTFSLVNGPSGMTVDSAGVIRWQPVAVTDAPLPVEFKVSDSRTGGDVTVSYALSVVATGRNAAPLVVSVPRMTGTAESLYAYDLVARDADGDPVFWTLVAAPQGMSLDSLRGTLRWLPEHDQTGPASVTVRVTDAYGASGEQSFTVHVSCVNQPPQITSVPVTVANANYSYGYAVRAVDPEGDPLSFSFDQAPAGMAFLPGTSVIRWVPTAPQVGPQAVTVRVTDQAGNFATQSFTVGVEAGAPNRSPVVTSKARTIATLNSPYTYAVTANDADGDPIDFALATAPVGMSIDKTSGVVTWLATEAGKNSVTVTASDGRGGRGVQTFTLTARANQAPTLAAVADRSVVAGATFRLSVTATDPDSDALVYGLVQAPTGTTIDSFGRLVWQSNAPPRAEPITVSVTDAGGLSDTRSFTLTLTPDTQAPNVSLFVSPNPVNQGQSVSVQVAATDNVGVTSLAVGIVQGGVTTPLALTPQGTARFTPAIAGRYTFVATATDAAGNVGTASSELRAVNPNDRTGPTVSFTRLAQLLPGGQTRQFDPATGVASVTYLTDVFGTIHDADGQLDSWSVLVARADLVDGNNLNPADSIWRTVATGTAEVNDGKIFTFDPTTLQNDRYTILVVAYDANGHGTTKGVDIDVTGNAKLGEFKLEFTDLSLPLNGIPIQITRVYDSRDASDSKDFGYGWTLGVRDAKIRETVPPGPGDGLFSEAKAFHDGTKVYINLPDGQRAGFTFKPVVAGGSFFGTVYAPKFVADPGVAWKLEVDNSSIHPNARGEFQTLLFPLDFNPDNYRLISPDGTTYSYNQYSGIQRIEDKNGNSVTFAADGITHSGGRHVSFVRDGQGRITDIIDPNGKSIHYAYTAAGDLKSVTDQANQTTQITYRTDRPHYLDAITDPLGRRAVKTEYDASGRVSAIIDANGNRTEQSFDPLNFRETVKDARGNPTVITYNERGNVVRTELATDFGPVVKQTFYEDPLNPDKETKTIDPRGFVTTKSFDARGNTLSETTPDGTTRYTYTDTNKLLTVTDTLGRVTAYDYSAQGNLVRVVNALGDSSSFTYDALGRVATFADFAGNTTKFLEYCECGRPMKIQNPDGSVRRIETNGFSQVTKTIDELGNTTGNVYDDIGRLIRVIDGEGHAANYEYEAGTANVAKVTDPLGNVTRYTYDAAGRKTRITDAEGGVTSFTYDANGNQTTVTDPVGNITTFVYDQANRVKQEIDPLGASRFYQYDAAGNVTQEIDRNGRKRTFEYDPMNRVTAEKWWAAGGSIIRVISSGYDNAGNLLGNSDPDAVLGYTYDALNRVRTATTTYPGTNVPTVTLTYGYDRNGNRTSVADNLGVRQDSVYGGRNELLSRTMTGIGVAQTRVEFEYRANGERSKLKRFADATGTALVGSSTYDYYKNGLSKTIIHANAAGDTLVRYDYVYDDAGRLTQETHHGDTYQYGYDRTSQLLTVVKDGLLYESFSYDKNGNRIAVTGPTAGVYQTGLGNQYITDSTYTYTYDAEGNTKTKTEIATGNVTEYFWDYRNRLLKVEERSAGGVVLSLAEYAYDPQGRRISQNANGEVLLTMYESENAWADYSGGGVDAGRYLFGERTDEILAQRKPGNSFAWHLTDKLGTIRDLVGRLGASIKTSGYSAFGQILSQTNSAVVTRYTFTGRENNAAIAEYYFRTRYYEPTSGRFISADQIGFESLDYNLYLYVTNSPLNGIDPTGESELFENIKLRIETTYNRISNIADFSCNIRKIALTVLIGLSAINNPADARTILGNVAKARQNQSRVERVCAVVNRKKGGISGSK